jgi:hypothetical protein
MNQNDDGNQNDVISSRHSSMIMESEDTKLKVNGLMV